MTKGVGQELDSNKKLSRQEKDEWYTASSFALTKD